MRPELLVGQGRYVLGPPASVTSAKLLLMSRDEKYALGQRMTLALCSHGIYKRGAPRTDDNVHLCNLCLQLVFCNMWDAFECLQDDREFWKKDLRIAGRDFWVELIHLLTAIRSDTELAALQATVDANVTNCTSQYHPTFNFNVDLSVTTTFNRLCSMMESCLWSPLGVPIHELQRRYSSKGVWPVHKKDLLPRGVEKTFEGLLETWFRQQTREADIVFLCWLKMFRAEMHHELLRHRSRFLPKVVAILHDIARLSIENKAMNPRFLTMHDLLGSIISLSAGNTTESRRRTTQILKGYEKQLGDALADLNTAAMRLQSSGMLRGLADLKHVLDDAGITSRIKLDRKAEDLWAAALEPEDRFNIFALFLTGMNEVRSAGRCHGPGCIRSEPADGCGLNLLRCGRCKFFNYCSSTCQRAHWKAAARPHRETCSRFAEMYAIAPFHLDKKAFTAACVRAKVDLDTVTYLHVTAVDVADDIQTPRTAQVEAALLQGTPLTRSSTCETRLLTQLPSS